MLMGKLIQPGAMILTSAWCSMLRHDKCWYLTPQLYHTLGEVKRMMHIRRIGVEIYLILPVAKGHASIV